MDPGHVASGAYGVYPEVANVYYDAVFTRTRCLGPCQRGVVGSQPQGPAGTRMGLIGQAPRDGPASQPAS